MVDYYRNHRIDVNAVRVGDRFNAKVRLLRLFSRDKPHVEMVTCLKLRADHAEHSASFRAGGSACWACGAPSRATRYRSPDP
jgi:hypothetical protein